MGGPGSGRRKGSGKGKPMSYNAFQQAIRKQAKAQGKKLKFKWKGGGGRIVK